LVSAAVSSSEETTEKFSTASGYAGGPTIFLLPPIERDFATCKNRSAFGIGGSFPSEETTEKNYTTLRLRRRPYYFFTAADCEKGIKISQPAKTLMCPTSKFLQSPAKSAIKRLILETPLYRHLLLTMTMSSTPTSNLSNVDCERGHVSQRPPISYAPSKDETAMNASRETIKMKTPEGEVKVAVLGDNPGAEEYLHHINNFIRMLGRKKIEEDMLKLAKAVISPKALVRKLKTVPQGEKPAEKTARLVLLKAAAKKLVEAEVCEDAKLATVYDLFCKTLKEDLELQWDRIVKDMHA